MVWEMKVNEGESRRGKTPWIDRFFQIVCFLGSHRAPEDIGVASPVDDFFEQKHRCNWKVFRIMWDFHGTS